MNKLNKKKFNKKGIFEGFKSLLNLLIGGTLLLLGAIQLLAHLNIIPFSIPEIPKILMQIFLGFEGFYLMIDGFMVIMMHPMLTIADVLVGICVASMGMIPLLNDLMGILMPLDFLSVIVFHVCFILAGILLIINSFEMV
ncbi:MAG: hypothetical protein ACOCUI_03805 [bacterium]